VDFTFHSKLVAKAPQPAVANYASAAQQTVIAVVPLVVRAHAATKVAAQHAAWNRRRKVAQAVAARPKQPHAPKVKHAAQKANAMVLAKKQPPLAAKRASATAVAKKPPALAAKKTSATAVAKKQQPASAKLVARKNAARREPLSNP
jgi:hypothetical protein